MAELVRRHGVQVYRAGDRIQSRVAEREAKAVGGFGVELDVVVQDGSGFVKASGNSMSPSPSASVALEIPSATSESPSPSMSSPAAKVESAIKLVEGETAIAPKLAAVRKSTR